MTLRPPSPEIIDALQIDYHMWSAYVEGEARPLGTPLPMSRAESDEIAAVCEKFAALIRRTILMVFEKPELLDYWKFPRNLRRMIDAELRRPSREFDTLTRYDVFPTPKGWQLSEFNTDVPGGIHEASGLNALIGGQPREFRVVEHLTELTCRDKARPAVGIVYASGFGEDLEQCQFLRSAWNRRGIPAVLGNPSNLVYDGKRLTMFDQPVEILYRFFPAEWLDGVPQLEALLAAVSDGAVRMINPFAQLVAQSKKGMAFWYDRADLLTPEERELVRSHVPPTELFRVERLEEYLKRKDEIVVKRGFGRIGEQVLVGSMCSDEEWREELGWPLSEPHEWVVQDRFEVVPTIVEEEPVYPCYGAYVVADRFAGFYTRAAQRPFITTDAYTAAVRIS